ncbi:metallophosphoesterase [Thermococcus sp. M39]|uniref:metallophosphoesterase n=1 Tax=unclassified Thermococcus TaxID=2627626 RepID=UPI001438B315|nr:MULTISPECIES: metallophosphoesterase [unclassified Thermococcus]NJE07721.1 metallophosphoesterase [Thermococcus sp. M39]NJE12277.1 metallophosphoesterase [Thermococcus sp. LS2]
MVAVGILGDTHYPYKASYIPDLIFKKFSEENVELIIHTGDINEKIVLEKLEEIAPVIAVKGNTDTLNLPEEKIIEVGDIRIGILHGHQFLSLDTQTLKYKALDMDVDVLVFGHTHRFFYDVYEFIGKKIALLNPGSPTLPRMNSPTFVVAKIKNSSFRVEVVDLWKI